jgi:hypothetical protein
MDQPKESGSGTDLDPSFLRVFVASREMSFFVDMKKIMIFSPSRKDAKNDGIRHRRHGVFTPETNR